MWPLGYPENLLSHLLVHYADDTEFVDVRHRPPQHRRRQGQVVPAQVAASPAGRARDRARAAAMRSRPTTAHCHSTARSPTAAGGCAIGYLSSGTSPVVVTAGDRSFVQHRDRARACTRSTSRAGDEFKSVVDLWPRADGVTLCTDDVTVGRADAGPRPARRRPHDLPRPHLPRAERRPGRGRDHGAAHARGVQHRPDQRRLGRRHAGPLRLRRDPLLRPVRVPAQPALVPGSGARAPGAVGPALPVEAGAPDPAALLGRGRRGLRGRPTQRRRHLGGLGQPSDPHAALPARPARELADPDVEPVHRGRVLPRAAADLPRHGRPPRQRRCG